MSNNVGKDFDLLTEKITDSVRLSFLTFLEKHPGESLFACALSTYDDVAGVNFSVNSESNHKKNIDRVSKILPSQEINSEFIEGDLRWSPCEWGDYEYIGNGFFDNVNELISDKYKIYSNENKFNVFRSCVIESMILALKNLDSKSFFEHNGKRPIIFVSIYDSSDCDITEKRSAKILNSNFKEFRLRKSKPIIKDELQGSDAETSIDFQLSNLQNMICSNDLSYNSIETIFKKISKCNDLSIDKIIELLDDLTTYEGSGVDTVRYNLTKLISKYGDSSILTHMRLGELLERYCIHNNNKEVWQTTPVHIAACMRKLFKTYSSPKMMDNNSLLKHDEFIKKFREIFPK